MRDLLLVRGGGGGRAEGRGLPAPEGPPHRMPVDYHLARPSESAHSTLQPKEIISSRRWVSWTLGMASLVEDTFII